MLTLKLTDKEKSMLYKALNYQLVDEAFLNSFKGAKKDGEIKALIRLMDKVAKSLDIL